MSAESEGFGVDGSRQVTLLPDLIAASGRDPKTRPALFSQ
jgi:hypothetical protein